MKVFFEGVMQVVFEGGMAGKAGGHAEYSFKAEGFEFNFVYAYGETGMTRTDLETGETQSVGDHMSHLWITGTGDYEYEEVKAAIEKAAKSIRGVFEPLLRSLEREIEPTKTQQAVFQIPVRIET